MFAPVIIEHELSFKDGVFEGVIKLANPLPEDKTLIIEVYIDGVKKKTIIKRVHLGTQTILYRFKLDTKGEVKTFAYIDKRGYGKWSNKVTATTSAVEKHRFFSTSVAVMSLIALGLYLLLRK